MELWHLIFNNSEAMLEKSFSSFEAAHKRMLAEVNAAMNDFVQIADICDEEATLSAGGDVMHWMILETGGASPYAVVEVCGNDSNVCYSDNMHVARACLSESYRDAKESLGYCDTDEDSRHESFCTEDGAAVYHYGAGPAQLWKILPGSTAHDSLKEATV